MATLTNGRICNSNVQEWGSNNQICVEADSLIATAYDVINFLRFK